jgi:hypothetical protein
MLKSTRMKRSLALAFFCFVPTFLAAQEVEITAEPHHHEIFSNAQVRVFDVQVPAHEATLMHWHRHDYALVIIGDSKVLNEVKGKPPAPLSLHDGEVLFSPATFAHIARNQSDSSFRNVAVEFLQDDKLRERPAPKDDPRALEILQGGTQQILWTKDGVRCSLYDLQPGGVIPARDLGGPVLLIALNNSALRSGVHSRKPSAFSLATGETRWLPDNFLQPMTNASEGQARLIALEFP